MGIGKLKIERRPFRGKKPRAVLMPFGEICVVVNLQRQITKRRKDEDKYGEKHVFLRGMVQVGMIFLFSWP